MRRIARILCLVVVTSLVASSVPAHAQMGHLCKLVTWDFWIGKIEHCKDVGCSQVGPGRHDCRMYEIIPGQHVHGCECHYHPLKGELTPEYTAFFKLANGNPHSPALQQGNGYNMSDTSVMAPLFEYSTPMTAGQETVAIDDFSLDFTITDQDPDDPDTVWFDVTALSASFSTFASVGFGGQQTGPNTFGLFPEYEFSRDGSLNTAYNRGTVNRTTNEFHMFVYGWWTNDHYPSSNPLKVEIEIDGTFDFVNRSATFTYTIDGFEPCQGECAAP